MAHAGTAKPSVPKAALANHGRAKGHHGSSLEGVGFGTGNTVPTLSRPAVKAKTRKH